MHLIIVISHLESKILWTSVKISNPILSDYCWNVFHITKDLEMFTLVISHRISVYHKKLNLNFFLQQPQNQHQKHPFLGKFWSKHWWTPIMVASKTRPTMCEYHKRDRDLTLFKQLKGCLMTCCNQCFIFGQNMFQRLQCWYPSCLGISQNL
jgi:hypothetical protein